MSSLFLSKNKSLCLAFLLACASICEAGVQPGQIYDDRSPEFREMVDWVKKGIEGSSKLGFSKWNFDRHPEAMKCELASQQQWELYHPEKTLPKLYPDLSESDMVGAFCQGYELPVLVPKKVRPVQLLHNGWGYYLNSSKPKFVKYEEEEVPDFSGGTIRVWNPKMVFSPGSCTLEEVLELDPLDFQPPSRSPIQPDVESLRQGLREKYQAVGKVNSLTAFKLNWDQVVFTPSENESPPTALPLTNSKPLLREMVSPSWEPDEELDALQAKFLAGLMLRDLSGKGRIAKARATSTVRFGRAVTFWVKEEFADVEATVATRFVFFLDMYNEQGQLSDRANRLLMIHETAIEVDTETGSLLPQTSNHFEYVLMDDRERLSSHFFTENYHSVRDGYFEYLPTDEYDFFGFVAQPYGEFFPE